MLNVPPEAVGIARLLGGLLGLIVILLTQESNMLLGMITHGLHLLRLLLLWATHLIPNHIDSAVDQLGLPLLLSLVYRGGLETHSLRRYLLLDHLLLVDATCQRLWLLLDLLLLDIV